MPREKAIWSVQNIRRLVSKLSESPGNITATRRVRDIPHGKPVLLTFCARNHLARREQIGGGTGGLSS